MPAPAYFFENYFQTGEPAMDLMNKIEAQLTSAGWVFVEQVAYTQSVARIMRVWQNPAALNAAGADFYVGLIRNAASGQTYFAIRTFEGWNATTKAILRPTIGGSGGYQGFWGQINYANGIFMLPIGAHGTSATTYGSIVLTSTDGATWTSRRMPGTNPWVSTAYGNATWVAVGGQVWQNGSWNSVNTTLAASSTDNGVTWTARTMPTSSSWTDVVWGSGPGLFVAIALGSSFATSPDGVTWTTRAANGSGSWTNIAYGAGSYVAINNASSNACSQSSNGTAWTGRTLGATSYIWTDVAFGAGTFVAISTAGHISTSPDGINWTLKTSALSVGGNWQSITYGDSGFVAVNNGTTTTTRGWCYSSDGINWTSGNNNYDTGLTYASSIAFGAGQYVTSGTSTNNTISLSSLTDVVFGRPSTYGLASLAPFAPGDHSLVNVAVSTLNSPQTSYLYNEAAVALSATSSYDIAILASKSYLVVGVNVNGTGTQTFHVATGYFAPNYTDNPTANPPLFQTLNGGGPYGTSRNMRALPDTNNTYTFGGTLNPDGVLSGTHTGSTKDPVSQAIRATRVALTGQNILLAMTDSSGFRGWLYDCVAVAITSGTALKVGDTVTLGGSVYTAIGAARASNNGIWFGLFFNTTAGS